MLAQHNYTTATTFTVNVNETLFIGHKLQNWFSIPLATYFILLILAGICFNLVLIATIVTVHKLHSITNIFIINLAIGDLITVFINVTFDVDFLLRGYYPYGKIVCGFKEVSFLLSLPSSVANLFLLTFERFLAIRFPFKRIRYLTKGCVLLMIFASWSYTFLVAMFPIFYKHKHAVVVLHGNCWIQYPKEYIYFQLSVNFLIPVVFIIALNVALFTTATRHARTIQNNSLKPRSGRRSRQSMVSFVANVKAAKTVLLLVGIFLICWLTFIILAIMNTLCDICHPRELTWTGNAINYSSIALNPLLYGLLNKSIRRELIKKVIKLFSKCTGTDYNLRCRNSSTTHDTISMNIGGGNNSFQLRANESESFNATSKLISPSLDQHQIVSQHV